MQDRRWLVGLFVLVYLAMLLGGAALKPGYSPVAQYISELGATGSAHARLISLAGFIPVGVLCAVLLVVMAARVPLVGIGRVGYWLLLCEPLAWIGSALAPCDLGCPHGGSVWQVLHNLLGVLTYLGTTLGLVLMAAAPGLRPATRLLWIALAMAWLLLFLLMGTPALADVRGLLQRLAEWLVYGALCSAAWHLAGPRAIATSAATTRG